MTLESGNWKVVIIFDGPAMRNNILMFFSCVAVEKNELNFFLGYCWGNFDDVDDDELET